MTAPTPFTRDTVTYPGALTGTVPPWDIRRHRLWLGKPGAMIELPSPDPSTYSAPQSRGEVLQGLAGGGAAVIRFANTTGSWSMSWPLLAGYYRSRIDAFYRGVYAPGPYCYLPPEDVNRLTLVQSLCGLRNGLVEGWAAAVGALTYDATQAAVVSPCGVMRWHGATLNAVLSSSPLVGGVITPDPLFAAPYVPAEPVAASVWAWTSAGTASVRLGAVGRQADGSSLASATTTVTLTTTPQLVQVAATPGQLLASTFVGLEVTNLASTAPDLLFSNPQLEYRDFRTDWALGSGVPRVHVAPSGRDARTFDTHMNEAASLTLVDAIAGRA